ncbi:Lrp/AsnC family transcriptional regulator [Erythrobacter dokdonensis]|jgi:DNA-binding Lrp family transcriptional regulator|uniref:AsnC family transcriptional regulator n=1 Tax=Erythrobacter dokdonensis DSW-74 TaxID=1300349 RepID=A0A1A7BKH0_9SPHN|nr:Lrp/AsnC family transcriptional regulator [Erythrobacter dokdonensis]MEE4316031.1 Lrp/AsnC family transcriptional regulator [Erythrobacter sp.]OBV11670.1 AsnC family transcriptional regulator [Erythrobacter dokdonensis DSW-74]
MDRIDRKILDLLAGDSRLTGEQLGERVGLSPSAAHRRVKALEESGAILGYRARLSNAARGNPSTVFVHVTLTDQRQATMLAFEKALAQTPLVAETYLMSGESDYLLKVLVRSDDSYERIHREILSALPGVQRLVSQFTIRTLNGGE